MELKRKIGTLMALGAGMLALAAPVLSATPDRMRDAHDLGAGSGQASVAYFHANELATLASLSGVRPFGNYLDAAQRGGVAQPGPSEIVATSDDGFDWTAAMIGASSIVMLFLLAAFGVMAARHARARPLAR